jgi:hypothetical protein
MIHPQLWICVLGWAVLRHYYYSFNRCRLTVAIVISSFLSTIYEKLLHPNASVISQTQLSTQPTLTRVKPRVLQTRDMFVQSSHFLRPQTRPLLSFYNKPTYIPSPSTSTLKNKTADSYEILLTDHTISQLKILQPTDRCMGKLTNLREFGVNWNE